MQQNFAPIHKSMQDLCSELIFEKWIVSEKVREVMLHVDRKDFAPTNPYQNFPQQIGCNVVISASCILFRIFKRFFKRGKHRFRCRFWKWVFNSSNE